MKDILDIVIASKKDMIGEVQLEDVKQVFWACKIELLFNRFMKIGKIGLLNVNIDIQKLIKILYNRKFFCKLPELLEWRDVRNNIKVLITGIWLLFKGLITPEKIQEALKAFYLSEQSLYQDGIPMKLEYIQTVLKSSNRFVNKDIINLWIQLVGKQVLQPYLMLQLVALSVNRQKKMHNLMNQKIAFSDFVQLKDKTQIFNIPTATFPPRILLENSMKFSKICLKAKRNLNKEGGLKQFENRLSNKRLIKDVRQTLQRAKSLKFESVVIQQNSFQSSQERAKPRFNYSFDSNNTLNPRHSFLPQESKKRLIYLQGLKDVKDSYIPYQLIFQEQQKRKRVRRFSTSSTRSSQHGPITLREATLFCKSNN